MFSALCSHCSLCPPPRTLSFTEQSTEGSTSPTSGSLSDLPASSAQSGRCLFLTTLMLCGTFLSQLWACLLEFELLRRGNMADPFFPNIYILPAPDMSAELLNCIKYKFFRWTIGAFHYLTNSISFPSPHLPRGCSLHSKTNLVSRCPNAFFQIHSPLSLKHPYYWLWRC